MQKRTLVRLALCLMLATSMGIAQAQDLRSVDVKQALQMKSQGALLLDVREADEYTSGHAPGSTLIPLGQLGARLKEIEGYRNKTVVLICHSGRRSAVATEMLRKAGFTDAKNVEGGMIAWERNGLPLAKGMN
ncbi:rhodanese-like domain-containing protein [Noviherbaspirillum sp.]|uniref:rhodanese-like domain-containing protein n=1 Tax=Noviherbaspirillum sp. TaxID=1926288 RepID=UPI002B495097|nr:rhodanese-like domain-containing protein [Noviherbaspirillum sp.]HJV81162.1 rhodanese-like domain-containing protein [Noviherbaspirillum sp.]